MIETSLLLQMNKELFSTKKALEEKIQAALKEQGKAKRLEETVSTLQRASSTPAGGDEVGFRLSLLHGYMNGMLNN